MYSIESAVASYMRVWSDRAPGSALATSHPQISALIRAGWEHDVFTLAERTAIFDDLASLVPGDVTRVLDIGCGEGGFSEALNTANAAIPYRGLDASVEAVETASAAFGGRDFVVGNVWEYCLSAAHDWDFTVSVRCMFEDTSPAGDRELIKVLDAKSPRGFAIVCPADRVQGPGFQEGLQAALAASSGVVSSHFTGAWPGSEFAGDMTGLAVVYLSRAGTSTVAPAVNPRWAKFRAGSANKVRSRTAENLRLEKGENSLQYKTINVDADGTSTGIVNQNFTAAPDQGAFSKHQQRAQAKLSKYRS